MRRTTLRLDDDLLRESKAVAARRGITLTRLVEESLREKLDRQARVNRPRRPVELPTFEGGGGTRPGVDISDSKALWDLMDADVQDLNKLR